MYSEFKIQNNKGDKAIKYNKMEWHDILCEENKELQV